MLRRGSQSGAEGAIRHDPAVRSRAAAWRRAHDRTHQVLPAWAGPRTEQRRARPFIAKMGVPPGIRRDMLYSVAQFVHEPLGGAEDVS